MNKLLAKICEEPLENQLHSLRNGTKPKLQDNQTETVDFTPKSAKKVPGNIHEKTFAVSMEENSKEFPGTHAARCLL